MTIKNRGNQFQLDGIAASVRAAEAVIETLYAQTENTQPLTPVSIHLELQASGIDDLMESAANPPQPADENPGTSQSNGQGISIQTRKAYIKPRGKNQQRYVEAVLENDINFGIGPAGTGKTWLAVACAVQALEQNKVERILLVRPAVEAGEKLGFLPGDLAQKIDPYLRPLYDALYEMMGIEQVSKLIERNIIEVAPLAFMRGRTLNNSFVILDESQNTTREQMKMFLTRIGFGSTAVVTGDSTQIDLPRRQDSGLLHVAKVLENVNGVSFTYFTSRDVVRHPLVQRIVEAYAQHEDHDANKNSGH